MKKNILLYIGICLPILSLSMEKPPQLAAVYRLISSDDCEVVVQPQFLKNSEPLKTIFTGKFKESKQNKLLVPLTGAALETLVNLMHLDQINDEKGLGDDWCFKQLTSVLHADSNRGEYILDLLAQANEWMVCPMITDAITTEAAELIFHDEQARAECMQKMSVQDQLYLLNKFSLASRHARNYIPALKVLHAMKNKKELEDGALQKEWDWSTRCFLGAALDHMPDWAKQSGPRTVAEFIQSSVLQELDPFFKDKLYKKLEDPEYVDSATVHAMDRIDDTHVLYGGEGTAGILDLQNNTVKDLQNNLAAANPSGPVGDDPVKIGALASLSCDRFIISQQFYRPEFSIDITSKMGSIIKRRAFDHSVRYILAFDNQRVAVVHRALSQQVNQLDNLIDIFKSDDLMQCQTYIGHHGQIHCLLQVGSQLVSGAHDCTVRVWNLNVDDKLLHEADHKLQYHCPIYSLLHLGGPYVVCFGYNTAIWDIEKGENVTDEIGKRYSLRSCDGVNNTYGGKATIANKTGIGISLKKLLDTISGIPNLQTVIPFNPDHLLAVYDKLESPYCPIPAAIRVWNIHDGTVVSEQLIEKESVASITSADNKIIYGTTTGLMVKHVPQAYSSLTALLERLTLQKP